MLAFLESNISQLGVGRLFLYTTVRHYPSRILGQHWNAAPQRMVISKPRIESWSKLKNHGTHGFG